MKKTRFLSLVAAISMSTMLMAGGDIAPIEPQVNVPVGLNAQESGLYGSVSYSYGTFDTDHDSGIINGNITYFNDVGYSSLMLALGYKTCDYFAVEARYWFGFDTDERDVTFGQEFTISNDTWAIYAKPILPVTDKIEIYGLLGYASSDIEATRSGWEYKPDTDPDGFSWGAGIAYEVAPRIDFFVDYTNVYDDDYSAVSDPTVGFSDTIEYWNFGVTYAF